MALSYSADQKVYICKYKKETLKALYEKKSYFELPQMYMTSLFHKTLIYDIREKQKGRFLTYEIADANMAALSATYENYYLQCEIPLGWVGTSPKVLKRNNSFSELVTKTMPKLCGNYKLGNMALYFWGALYEVIQFYPERSTYIHKESFVKKILPYVYLDISKNKKFKESEKYKYFIEVLKSNNLNLKKIIIESKKIKIFEKIKVLARNFFIFLWRCIRYILKRIPGIKKHFISNTKSYWLRLTWDECSELSYQKVQKIIMDMIKDDIDFDKINL